MPLDLCLHFSDVGFGECPRTSKFLRRLRRILQGASKVWVTRRKDGRFAVVWHPNGGLALPLLKLQDPRVDEPLVNRLSWETPYGHFENDAIGGFSFYTNKALFGQGWDYMVSWDVGQAYIRGAFGGPPLEFHLNNVKLGQNRIKNRASRKGFSFPSNLLQWGKWFQYLPLLKVGLSPFTLKPFRPGQQLWVQFVPSDTAPKAWVRRCRRQTTPKDWALRRTRHPEPLVGRPRWFFECFKGIPSRVIQIALKLATLKVMYQLMQPHLRLGSRYRSRKGSNLPVVTVVYDVMNMIKALRTKHPHLGTCAFLMLLHKQETAWN